MAYRAGLIGLGKIAALYAEPDDPLPYCHAGGIRLAEGIDLVAAAEPDAARREEVRGTWKIPRTYASAVEMFAEESLDVVAVCAKGPLHAELSREALEAGVRVLFLEKPVGLSLEEVDELTALAEAKGVPVVASHTRHWGPHLLSLAEKIRGGLLGRVESVTSYCPGGILGFAVHGVDMLCQFAGYDPVGVCARGAKTSEPVPDGFESEYHVDGALVEFASGVVGTLVGNPGKRPTFCVEVMGTEGYGRIGFYTEPELFDADGKTIKYQMPPAQSPFVVAYGQIVDYLDNGRPPHCIAEQYVPVNELAFGMIESIASGARVKLPNKKRDRKIYCMG